MNSFLIWPSRLWEPCITDQNLLRHRNSTSHTTRLLQNTETRGEERKQCLSRPRLRAVRDTTVRYCTLVCTLYREQEQDCYWTSLYRAYQSWVSVGASTGQTRMQLTSVPDQLARSCNLPQCQINLQDQLARTRLVRRARTGVTRM